MKQLLQLNGIIPVLNTPFTEKDTIDHQALEKHVREAINAGVVGFLVPAMASEVNKLSHKEKLVMVETVMKTVDGKMPVFVGTAAPTQEESKKIMKDYQQLGYRHFLVQLPYHNDKQFRSDFLQLVESEPEIIMLQDWDPNGYGLPDDLIMALYEEVPAFRCLKVETVPAGIKYSRMLELSGGQMHISGGWAVSQMPEALKRGVHAFMTTGMHWIYTEIYRRFQMNDLQGSVSLFNELLPVLAFSNQHLDISIHFFKRLLWRQGLYPTPNVRDPILPFDEIHREHADQLIEYIIRKESELKHSKA